MLCTTIAILKCALLCRYHRLYKPIGIYTFAEHRVQKRRENPGNYPLLSPHSPCDTVAIENPGKTKKALQTQPPYSILYLYISLTYEWTAWHVTVVASVFVTPLHSKHRYTQDHYAISKTT